MVTAISKVRVVAVVRKVMVGVEARVGRITRSIIKGVPMATALPRENRT